MPLQVCSGATLKCGCGDAVSKLTVLPAHGVLTSSLRAANIGDHVPFVNIMSFGLCSAPINPAVAAATAAATAAAFGVPTFAPAPCEPATPNPWFPGSETVLLDHLAALSSDSEVICIWGGLITILQAGQETVIIP